MRISRPILQFNKLVLTGCCNYFLFCCIIVLALNHFTGHNELKILLIVRYFMNLADVFCSYFTRIKRYVLT